MAPKTQITESFSSGVASNLQTYVYRLIDPRNGETFYVGKGKHNRVFSHIRGEQNIGGDDLNNKMRRIRDIRMAGFDVAHVIHRHGMTNKTALEVEGALIDAYPGLENIAGGNSNHDRGTMHAEEIERRYAARPAVFKHRAVLISVNRSSTERTSLYEATRYAWKVSLPRVREAEVVLATIRGMIVGAFVADDWMEATTENFPNRSEDNQPGRYGFVGSEASKKVQRMYIGKRVPDRFRKRGAANPIKYTWRR
jgi:hypothetical protein